MSRIIKAYVLVIVMHLLLCSAEFEHILNEVSGPFRQLTVVVFRKSSTIGFAEVSPA
jgi:hypothetical protein